MNSLMNTLKKKIRTFLTGKELRVQLLLLLALFAASLIIYRGYIFGNELMVYDDVGGDTWQQYTMHYATIVNHLREGTFSLWDFTNGFGTSMFNLNLFDPSLMVLYGLGVLLGPAHMLFFLVWIQIGRVLLAGWIFYRYLSIFSFSRGAKAVSAFTYGLSGYLLVWGQHYQFGMVTIYFPLLLLCCERYIRGERRGKLLPAAVFLCGIYSVYFTYMCLIGAGFYLLFRVFMEDMTGKARAGKFFGGCLHMLLGLGMSLVIFLPMAAVLLNVSSRLSGKFSLLKLLKSCFPPGISNYYPSLLVRPFSTNLQNLQELGDQVYEGFWNYYEDPVLFCSTLTVFLNVQFLIVLRKTSLAPRIRRSIYVAAAFILLMLLLPVGGFVFNAFTAPTFRFTFVLIPVFLTASAWMWDYLKNGGRISIPGLLLVCVFMYRAYYQGYQDSVFREYRMNALILAVTGTVMAVCLLAFCLLREEGEKGRHCRRAVMGVLAAALVVNVISEGSTTYQDRISLKKEDTPPEEMEAQAALYAEETSAEDSERQARGSLLRPQTYFRELYSQYIQDALDYLEQIDDEFYRVEKDFSSATISMDSLAQGYRGISTYNSVMNGNVKEFVDTCCPGLYYSDRNRYAFWDNASNNWLAAFTGIRYLLSRDAELDPDRYVLLKQFGSLYLYQNARESDVARFYDEAISEESLKSVEKKERRRMLTRAIAVEGGAEVSSADEIENSEARKNSSVTLYAPEKDSLVTGEIQAASDGYVLFMIPFEDGWSLTIDGEETELIRGDLGFLACRVSEGDHSLTLTYHAPLLKEGAVLSGICWLLYFQLLMTFTMRIKRKTTRRKQTAPMNTYGR